ncbi:hypothetical protein R3W88_004185 [Solanum pinnatisectum]|uniref:At2g35280-like TPR domain-containing protein n=1 Tax=Solanum pinnatisectum TaxID=50273 RepID=A0AAV9K8Q8_9SOLN|nr:hypothetical protein R3W88_004185 [Solanum pinnatisectum]
MGTLKECEEHTIQRFHGQMHRLCVFNVFFFFQNNFFKNINPDVALELIDKASKGEHGAAKYAFALISICLDGEYSQQGVKTIGEIKVTKEQREITRQYRRRFQEMNLSYFVLNPIFDNKPPRCCTIKHVPLVRKSARDSADDEEDEHCYACSSDEEIRHFVFYY